jgi:virulence-associated protein VapD
LEIKKLAFAKYENGLDKLNWNQVRELLNRSCTNTILFTVYLNKSKPGETSNDLDMKTKIKKLQKQDAQISQTIENVKRHKLKGYVIEKENLFKLRKARNKRHFNQPPYFQMS